MLRKRTGIGVALRRMRNDALKVLGRVASRVVRALPVGPRTRRFLAERTWAHLPSETLDAYLVSGYQNPRINVQSILVRHFLTRRLFDDEFDDLMDEEIRFALRLNETLRLRARELEAEMGSFIDPVKHAGVKKVDEFIAGRDGEFIARWHRHLRLVTRPRSRSSNSLAARRTTIATSRNPGSDDPRPPGST